MAPVLLVSPARRAAAVAASGAPSHALTFRSPGGEILRLDGKRLDDRLDLVFNDIAEPKTGLTPPDADAVAQLLAFARTWPGERPLLVSCYAGVSRSTAAAFLIACARAEPGREAALARTLRVVAPSATPNLLVVALADAALGRAGRMSEAAAAIGRGADAFEGETFAWDLETGEALRLAPAGAAPDQPSPERR